MRRLGSTVRRPETNARASAETRFHADDDVDTLPAVTSANRSSVG